MLTREMHVKREKAKQEFLGKEDGIDIAVNEGEKEEYYCFKPAAIGEVDGVGSLPRLTYAYVKMEDDEEDSDIDLPDDESDEVDLNDLLRRYKCARRKFSK